MDKLAFINMVKDGAIAAYKQHGILPSVTIAQAILESGWGDSALTRQANNLFGIKRWGYPTYVTMPTTEYYNGKKTTVNADFRKYNSWSESINDHSSFILGNARYNNLVGQKDYRTACKLIQQDGYATDPNYSNLLIQIIEVNKLYDFDKVQDNPVKVIYMEDDIMFSEKFYLDSNPDVAKAVANKEFKNGKDHYLQYGRKEGRRPVPVLPNDYCEGAYLTNNSDVAAAVTKGEFVCGAEHYLLYGYSENRKHC